jgi:hypothetical protein
MDGVNPQHGGRLHEVPQPEEEMKEEFGVRGSGFGVRIVENPELVEGRRADC